MSDEHIDAIDCFLQYMYTGEHFLRHIGSRGGAQGYLEEDSSTVGVDDTGEQLLSHARSYPPADTLRMQVSASIFLPHSCSLYPLHDNPSSTPVGLHVAPGQGTSTSASGPPLSKE